MKKLERRFKRAFENLEADVQTDADAEENANLSKQVAVLQADLSEKDTRLKKLGAELAALTEKGAKAKVKITGLEAAAKTTAVETANLQAAVEQAKDGGPDMAAASEKITDLEAELAALKAKLEETEAQSENYFDRMRKLRGTLRVMRVGLKKNVLNAEDLNMVMQAELEALQTQRELDLKEVNVVLEKLTPLVEGK